MKARFAVMVVLAAALTEGCRRAETPAPTPSPTATVATPIPAPAATPTRSPAAPSAGAALLDPSRATERAPDRFRVRFETTKGPFVVEVKREWAPRGADRFYNLVRAGYYDDVALPRSLPLPGLRVSHDQLAYLSRISGSAQLPLPAFHFSSDRPCSFFHQVLHAPDAPLVHIMRQTRYGEWLLSERTLPIV